MLLNLELLFHLVRAQLKNWHDQRMISMWAQNEVSAPSMLEYLTLNQCARKTFRSPKEFELSNQLFSEPISSPE